MLLIAEILCILTGMAPLITGYYQSNLSTVAIACFVVGSLWLLSSWRHWAWVASAGLLAFTILAGMGVWTGLSPFLMAESILGSLLAWDLADFSHRRREAAPEDDLRKLEKNHIVRLASLGAIGLSLDLAAVLVHLRISFGWMFILAIATVLGMMQLVKRLRRG